MKGSAPWSRIHAGTINRSDRPTSNSPRRSILGSISNANSIKYISIFMSVEGSLALSPVTPMDPPSHGPLLLHSPSPALTRLVALVTHIEAGLPSGSVPCFDSGRVREVEVAEIGV